MNKKLLTILFLLCELFLYSWFIIIDFSPTLSFSSSPIKYFSIIIVFLFGICIHYSSTQRIFNSIVIALFFTIVADYFLLFADNFLPGILFFIFVQSSYYLHLKGYKVLLPMGIFLLSFTILETIAIYYEFPHMIALFIPLIIYLLLTFLNIFHYSIAIKCSKDNNKEYMLLLLGILLLFLCDIHVGLSNLSGFLTIKNTFLLNYVFLSSKLIWIFYLPSQICISCSLLVKNIGKDL